MAIWEVVGVAVTACVILVCCGIFCNWRIRKIRTSRANTTYIPITNNTTETEQETNNSIEIEVKPNASKAIETVCTSGIPSEPKDVEVVTHTNNDNNDVSDNLSGMEASVSYLNNNINNNYKNCNETASIAINSDKHGSNSKNSDWLSLLSAGFLRHGIFNSNNRGHATGVDDIAMILCKYLDYFLYINNSKYSTVEYIDGGFDCKFHTLREYGWSSIIYAQYISQRFDNLRQNMYSSIHTNDGKNIKMTAQLTNQSSKLEEYGAGGYQTEWGVIGIPKKLINYYNNSNNSDNSDDISNVKYSWDDLKRIFESSGKDYCLRYGPVGVCPLVKIEFAPFDAFVRYHLDFEHKGHSWLQKEEISYRGLGCENELQQCSSQLRGRKKSVEPVTFGINDKIDMFVECSRDNGDNRDRYYLYFLKNGKTLYNSEKHKKIELDFEKYDYLPALSSRCVHGCETQFTVTLEDEEK